MASKEKVEIKRSDKFQEVDEELTRAMAELDSTIERVSLIFQPESDLAATGGEDLKSGDGQPAEREALEAEAPEEQSASSEEQ
ncbi:MAG: hypothetical protein JNK74_16850 [Candidatus Hydrogenedentes bacterium]|nr:hypothetical protein [Candidatus Hydrogenedentota bacterium]